MTNLEIGVVDSQCDNILRYLQDGNNICPQEALSLFACFRLAARISDLRKLGNSIDKKMVTSVNRFGVRVRFAVYSIKK